MRLTIVAGLIMGLSMAIQSALNARTKAKVGNAASAAGVHVGVVAPWYVAQDVQRSLGEHRG
jgi:ascorbate-specific PTS system EIIC-type component UlaA